MIILIIKVNFVSIFRHVCMNKCIFCHVIMQCVINQLERVSIGKVHSILQMKQLFRLNSSASIVFDETLDI